MWIHYLHFSFVRFNKVAIENKTHKNVIGLSRDNNVSYTVISTQGRRSSEDRLGTVFGTVLGVLVKRLKNIKG